MKPPNKKITIADYFECTRCNINSLGKQMCPCPRGSCEAEKMGIVATSVEVILSLDKKKAEILKHKEKDLYLLSNLKRI